MGRALSIEKDQDKLLRLILFLSKRITGADAGSIFLVEQDEEGKKRLRFKYSHTFSRDIPLEEIVIPMDKKSISGYVAVTGQVLNIPDAYQLPPDSPYSFNPSFDRKNDYRSPLHAGGADEEPRGRDHRRDPAHQLQGRALTGSMTANTRPSPSSWRNRRTSTATWSCSTGSTTACWRPWRDRRPSPSRTTG